MYVCQLLLHTPTKTRNLWVHARWKSHTHCGSTRMRTNNSPHSHSSHVYEWGYMHGDVCVCIYDICNYRERHELIQEETGSRETGAEKNQYREPHRTGVGAEKSLKPSSKQGRGERGYPPDEPTGRFTPRVYKGVEDQDDRHLDHIIFADRHPRAHQVIPLSIHLRENPSRIH